MPEETDFHWEDCRFAEPLAEGCMPPERVLDSVMHERRAFMPNAVFEVLDSADATRLMELESAFMTRPDIDKIHLSEIQTRIVQTGEIIRMHLAQAVHAYGNLELMQDVTYHQLDTLLQEAGNVHARAAKARELIHADKPEPARLAHVHALSIAHFRTNYIALLKRAEAMQKDAGKTRTFLHFNRAQQAVGQHAPQQELISLTGT